MSPVTVLSEAPRCASKLKLECGMSPVAGEGQAHTGRREWSGGRILSPTLLLRQC